MLFKKSLVAAAVSATPALAHYKDYPVNTYWGQNGVGDTLGQYCESSNVDTITLAFVNNSPKHGLGYPGTNFAAHCAADVYVKDGVDTKLLSGCSFIKEDLQKCKKLGKKILLSIGGEYSESSNYSLSSVEAGKEFAHYMFEIFGPYREGYHGPRPFDLSPEETFCVDGFDFDIETKFADQAPYVAMVQKLRDLISTVPEKMILSAAPQCPLDTKNFQMDTILAKAQFDRISIQFYNNPGCDGRSDGFNYDAWVSWLSETVNKNAEIFVGLPGSEAAAPAGGYLKPEAATELICKYKKHANFGGVMIWDAYLSTQNEDCRPGETFYDVVADALKCGGACGENILFCPKPPVTTTSSAVSTSTSSSISTSSSASTTMTTTSATSTSSSVLSTTSFVVSSTSSAETSSTSSAVSSATSSTESSTTSSVESSATSSVESSTSSSVGTSTSSGASSSQTSSASVPATTSSSASSPITSPATSSTATSSTSVTSSTTEEDECEEETYSASVPVSTSSARITSTASTSAVTSSATVSSSTASEEDDCEEETTSASMPFSTLSASTTSAPATSKPSASVTSPGPATYPASQPASSATGPATTEYSTSTVYTTKVHTITACPPSVTNCPVGEKTTEVIPIYTTVCPVTSEKPVPTYPAGGHGENGSPSAPGPVPTYPAGDNGGHDGSDSPSAPAPVPTYPAGEKGSPSAPAASYSAATPGSATSTYPVGGNGGHGSPSAPAPVATYPAGDKGEHGDDRGYPSAPAGSYPAATSGTETTKSPAVPSYPVVANYPVVSTLTKVVPVYPTAAQGNHTLPGTATGGYPVGPSPTKGSGHGGNSPAASSTAPGYPVTTAPVTAGSAKMMVSLGALFAVVLAL